MLIGDFMKETKLTFSLLGRRLSCLWTLARKSMVATERLGKLLSCDVRRHCVRLRLPGVYQGVIL